MTGTLGKFSRNSVALFAAPACLCLAAVLSPSSVLAALITSTWNFGAGGGDGTTWSQAGNWTNSNGAVAIPINGGGNTYNASIPSPGATVKVTGNTPVTSLTFEGTLSILGGSSNAQLSLSAPLTNSDTINVSSTGSGSAALSVANTITNLGDINFLFGTGSNHQRTLTGDVANQGSIEIEAETKLQLGGKLTNSGTLHIGPHSTLSVLGSPTLKLLAGQVNNEGVVSLIDVQFEMHGGALDNAEIFELFASDFTFAGGNLTGNPIVLQDCTFTMLANATGSGTIRLSSGCQFNGEIQSGPTIDVVGFTTSAGNMINSGTIHLTTANSQIVISNGALINKGSLQAKLTGGTVDADLDNRNAITVDPGAIAYLSKPSAHHVNTGTITVGAGSLVQLGPNATFEMNGGTIDNQGAFNVGDSVNSYSGVFHFNAGSLTGNPIILYKSSPTIAPGSTGTGAFTIRGINNTLNGNLMAGQTVHIQAGNPTGSATVAATDGFTNYGTLEFDGSGNSTLNIHGAMVNEGTMLFKLGNKLVAANLVNYGLIVAEPGAVALLTRFVGDPTPHQYSNHGTVKVQGTLGLSSVFPAVFTNELDGLFQLSGQFTSGDGTFINDGIMSLGSTFISVQFVADFVQENSGQLLIDLGGTTAGSGYDRLRITGGATLGGEIEISLLNSFVPSPLDVFTVLTTTTGITGTFDNTPGGLVSFSGGTFKVTYNANSVVLSNFQSVPEPGTIGLALCGAAMLVLCAWRARR